jgi:hypothetical protein
VGSSRDCGGRSLRSLANRRESRGGRASESKTFVKRSTPTVHLNKNMRLKTTESKYLLRKTFTLGRHNECQSGNVIQSWGSRDLRVPDTPFAPAICLRLWNVEWFILCGEFTRLPLLTENALPYHVRFGDYRVHLARNHDVEDSICNIAHCLLRQ